MKTFWAGFIVGFVCAVIILNYFNFIEKTKEIQVKSETHEDVLQNKKFEHHNDINTETVTKAYYPSGKLKSEKTEKKINHNFDFKVEQDKYHLNIQQDIKEKEETIQKQLNFMIGISYPVFDMIKPFDYKAVDIIFGYRLIADFYIFGKTNIAFNQYSIGILTFL